MITLAFMGLAATAAIALLAWGVSVLKRDVSIVDSFWGLMILAAGITYGPGWLLAPAAIWAVRLSVHITWRNWGKPEDRRYQAVRRRNEPGFALKSLYLVFGLQAALAWIVSAPLLATAGETSPGSWLALVGGAVAVFGIAFETVADWQLARWRVRGDAGSAVLDRGLWRYSRHPNYFGESCVWWGFGLSALAVGAWWALASPLLMTLFLLRITGVALLEEDLSARRPAYREYVARTNAFFPGPRRARKGMQP